MSHLPFCHTTPVNSQKFIPVYRVNPSLSSVPYMAPLVNIYFNFRRDHKKILASRLWVGRRKEPILGYVQKNNEKIMQGVKG